MHLYALINILYIVYIFKLLRGLTFIERDNYNVEYCTVKENYERHLFEIGFPHFSTALVYGYMIPRTPGCISQQPIHLY